MTQISELARLCTFNFTIEFNPHKGNFQSVSDYIQGYKSMGLIDDEDFDIDIQESMIKLDKIVIIRCYRNSVGFWIVYHHDIDEAIKNMIHIITNDK